MREDGPARPPSRKPLAWRLSGEGAAAASTGCKSPGASTEQQGRCLVAWGLTSRNLRDYKGAERPWHAKRAESGRARFPSFCAPPLFLRAHALSCPGLRPCSTTPAHLPTRPAKHQTVRCAKASSRTYRRHHGLSELSSTQGPSRRKSLCKLLSQVRRATERVSSTECHA